MNTKRQRDSSKQNIKQFLTTSAHYQEVNPTSVRKESQYLRSQEQKELQMPKSGIPMDLQATSVKKFSKPVYAIPVITVLRSNAIMWLDNQQKNKQVGIKTHAHDTIHS